MRERDELFLRWELGVADADDEAALNELLRDPAARRAFARHARIAAALGTPQSASAVAPATARVAMRPRRMRRLRPAATPRLALAAGFALLVGVVALLTAMPRREAPTTSVHSRPAPAAAAAATTPVFARLEAADRTSVLTPDGRRRAGISGGFLLPGETVETGAGSAVLVLVAANGGTAARLELAAGSRLGLPPGGADPGGAPMRLGLARGRVRAEVAPRPAGAAFTIATPLASAEVVGTRFTLSADEGGARLAVDHGAVRLATPTDGGVLVAAGRAALVSEGLASIVPADADPDLPLPPGSRVLQRFAPVRDLGWRGVVEDAEAGPSWRSVAPRPGDPWCRAELRSPIARDGWAVEAGTWLRFRYHVERSTPGLELVVHLKPEDETNYAQRVAADPAEGWHQALLRVDGAFRHIEPNQDALAVGERIHGAVWGAMRDANGDQTPVRFWIRDAVVFVAP